MDIGMIRNKKLALAFSGVLFLSALGGCTTIGEDFGYAPSDSELSELVVGLDSQDRVTELVGSPASKNLRGQEVWFYMSMRKETYAFREPEITDRQLVAISFDAQGSISNIERFTMEDGRVITLSRRVTDDPRKGISFLRQAFGNLGRLDPTESFN